MAANGAEWREPVSFRAVAAAPRGNSGGSRLAALEYNRSASKPSLDWSAEQPNSATETRRVSRR